MLTPGTRLGPYTIRAPLGAGGMGEVYRAHDSKLDREVAVKVLPEEVAEDRDRLARFEREARAVAALSHPNILAIHDFGRVNGTAYAVMELLEGETLKDRLENGPVVERKAVEIAAQMARGLGAAHEKSILHRDLKPENVFITRDGQVKLLDFGLAKIHGPRVGSADAKTLESGTDPGKVMGTVGYMSPEQVRGEATDHRSDIFSFGVLLYEMLSGRRAFQGDSAVETMSAILRQEPEDLSASGVHVPPALDRVVRRCLEKQPGERFQSSRDLAFALENASGTSVSRVGDLPLPGRPARNRLWRSVPFAVLFALGILTGVAVHQRLTPPGGATGGVRIRPLTFSGRDAEPAASPDGRLVAFRSDRDGISRIWIKQIVGGGEAPLTEGQDFSPQFSPDGSGVLFLRREGSTSSAYRVALVGGEPRKLLDEVNLASWSPEGDRIGFLRTRQEGGSQIASFGVADAQGGNERELAVTENFGYSHLRWSPDGSILSVVEANLTGSYSESILILDAESGDLHRLTASGPGRITGVTWSGSGSQMLFALSANLIGDQAGALSRVLIQDLDSRRERTLFWTSGLFPTASAYSTFTILAPGVLVYDDDRIVQNLVEFPIGDKRVPARPWARGNARDRQPCYSPDGRSIIFSSNRSGNLDLWTLSTENGTVRQLTDDAAQDWDPGFTPDGESIVWSSDRSGNLEIWTADKDGSGARQLTRDGRDAENPTVTPDGWVLYWSAHPEKSGVWKIRTDGTEATRLREGTYNITEVSPDGRTCAFVSPNVTSFRNTLLFVNVETGELDPARIVIPFRVGSSTIGWGRSRWMPDGRAIAYVGENEQGLPGIFVQDFVPGEDTSSTRRPLAGFSPDFISESFDISPDGTRLTLSVLNETFNIMIAEDVPGVAPPSRGKD